MKESEWSSDERRALYHLEAWARWMRMDRTRGMSAPSRSAGFDHRAAASRSIEDMAEVEDMRCAETCDAVVRSLAPVEEAAINHRYLRAVYRFPREPYEIILYRAIINVGKGLHARGVVHP